jgi:predicted AlkP superfamily pyrophosphatase or phosphodiesterase
MINKFLKLLPCALLLAGFTVSAQTVKKTVAQKTTLSQPKLVVGIVVDQMRQDYLYRYYDKYGEGGFKRMMREGFVSRNHHYQYANTVTGAGHASIFTGTVPAINGIMGNDWFDPITKTPVHNVGDSTVSTVGSPSAGAGKKSPRNLLTSTITDQLQIATGFRAKTIGISLKDRGAILPAGHTATGAYWFDSQYGNFVTSTFYHKELPKWVEEFNARKLPLEYAKLTWNTLLPIEQYVESTSDDKPYERALLGKATATFPYTLESRFGSPFSGVTGSPYGNTLLKELAKAAVKGEGLGKDEITDFLTVSFSTPDGIGHSYGPNSIEQQDDYLRLDKEFEDFFNFLDKEVGKGQYTVFLTADHGVMDIAGFWKENKLPAGTLSGSAISKKIEESLVSTFGPGKYILAYDNHQLYLDHDVLKANKTTVEAVTEVVRQVVVRTDGLADAVNLRELGKYALPGEVHDLIRNVYNAKRSGDIYIITQPGWYGGGDQGTTHGSLYNYDTNTPFVLFGWGVKKGETFRRTYITDIASTIGSILHILSPSGNIGNPVYEAIK